MNGSKIIRAGTKFQDEIGSSRRQLIDQNGSKTTIIDIVNRADPWLSNIRVTLASGSGFYLLERIQDFAQLREYKRKSGSKLRQLNIRSDPNVIVNDITNRADLWFSKHQGYACRRIRNYSLERLLHFRTGSSVWKKRNRV